MVDDDGGHGVVEELEELTTWPPPGVVDDDDGHGVVEELMTGLIDEEETGGCGVVQLHSSWSPFETTAGTPGVPLPLPPGGIGNLEPPAGYAVPFDAQAASPADVDD